MQRAASSCSAILAWVLFWLAWLGCSEPKAAAVDTAPFTAAIARYLDQNNMGMVVKEIKEGPSVTGQTATLVASLTRAEVGGPNVTWKFHFRKDAQGAWQVVGREE